MTKLEILLPRHEIEATIKRLAAEITRDYHGKNPLIIGVLKGSFIFLADLVRQLDFPLEIDFITLSSYMNHTESCGEINLKQPFTVPIEGRHVLLVEDIIDSGLTLRFLIDYINSHCTAASLNLCALLDKPSRRKAPVDINYLGFTVPDRFIVGYGLDCAQKYRNMPDICCLEE